MLGCIGKGTQEEDRKGTYKYDRHCSGQLISEGVRLRNTASEVFHSNPYQTITTFSFMQLILEQVSHGNSMTGAGWHKNRIMKTMRRLVRMTNEK